jgi:hypothetical protein
MGYDVTAAEAAAAAGSKEMNEMTAAGGTTQTGNRNTAV